MFATKLMWMLYVRTEQDLSRELSDAVMVALRVQSGMRILCRSVRCTEAPDANMLALPDVVAGIHMDGRTERTLSTDADMLALGRV